MNRLCDKCSYQNDCFEDSHCKFLPAETKEGDPDAIKNYEYLKVLKIEDMVEVLSKGLGVSPAFVAAWLVKEADLNN